MKLCALLACAVVMLAACECGRVADAPAADPATAPRRENVDASGDAVPPVSAAGGASLEAKVASRNEARRVGDTAVHALEAAFDGDTLVVIRNGARRIACNPTCALEHDCGFRDNAACVQDSCDGDVRRVSRMDYCLALDDSVTCLDAARCSCNESCWKRGECAKDHGGDADCERACVSLVQQDSAARYRENRCILERACSEIAACGAL